MTDDILVARCFLAGRTSQEIGSASDYGRVEILCPEQNPMEVVDASEAIFQELTDRGYRPDDDYVIIAGSSILSALLLARAGEFSPDGAVRCLLFDARARRYVARRVRLRKESR